MHDVITNLSSCAGCAVVQGAIVVAGGSDGQRRLDSVERLELDGARGWELIQSLDAPRWGLVCTAVGGIALVCGGIVGSGGAQPSRNVLAFEDHSWVCFPPMV